jgi:hypothetical protein
MYLSFVTWTEKANQMDSYYFLNTWMPKHNETCKKWDVKLLKQGIPFGTVETHLYVYETDLELSKYQDFRDEITNIEEGLFGYTKTTIVNCPF